MNDFLQATVEPHDDLYELKTVNKVFMSQGLKGNYNEEESYIHTWHRRFGHRDIKKCDKGYSK